MVNINDPDLVSGIKANDPTYLKALVDLYAERLLAFVMKIGLSRQDSKEVVNDSLYKIIVNINRFNTDRGSKFSSWVTRITINTAKDKLKQMKDPPISQSIDERETRGIQDTEALWRGSSQQDSEIGQLCQNIMTQALESLSETDQTILRCRACEIPHKEIAKLLKKTTGAVKTGHNRALERLKNQYISMLESFEDQKTSLAVRTFLGIEAVNE